MEIGISVSFLKDQDDLKMMTALLDWGYTSLDYNYNDYTAYYTEENWQKHAALIQSLLQEKSAKIHQIHGPWIRYLDEETKEEEKKQKIRRGIELCAFLGCPVYVMHPVKFKIPEKYTLEEALDYNTSLFQELGEFAKKHHVKIALENLYRYDKVTRRGCETGCNNSAELMALAKRLDPEVFGFCLDVGHAQINQQDPSQIIRDYGSSLIALHLHDNDEYTDAHLPMTYGKINWDELVSSLKQVDFKGVFSMEVVCRNPKLAKEEAIYLHQLAQKLIEAV